MRKRIFMIPMLSILLSGCGIQDTFNALESNRYAVDQATCAIQQNVMAIQSANQSISANREEIEKLNKTLKHAKAGE